MNEFSTLRITESEHSPLRIGRCDDDGFQQVIVVSGGGAAPVATVAFDQSTPGSTNKVTVGSDVIHTIQDNAIPAGTNLVGKVGIDQTTPGTTNKVSLLNDVVHTAVDSIAAGTNLLGKVGIDQTTPGTTNKVTVGSDVIHTIVDSSVTPFDLNLNSTHTSFNDLLIAQLDPVVQLDFVYGINTQLMLSSVVTTGVVDTTLSKLRLQSGIGAAGSAIFASKRTGKYRPGEGSLARFTPIFGTPSSSSTQIMGVGNAIDGYFFGYNGTTFGILHRARSVDTWIPQSTWNGDKSDGTGTSGMTWNPAFGNPVMILYPFLGFGNITFYVQDSITSRWNLVHTIRYTNSHTDTAIGNPNLGFYAQSLNTGSTTNKIMYCGSIGLFITGQRSFNSTVIWGKDSFKINVSTETNLLTIKNCTTYNTVANRGLVKILGLSFFAAGGSAISAGVFRLKINSTLGGSPVFTTIDGTSADNGVTITSGNSIVSFDTAGTTVTGGTYIYSQIISSNAGSGNNIDLSPLDIFIVPGETLTVSGFSSVIATMGCTLNWTCEI
jgi:hypothetical protein